MLSELQAIIEGQHEWSVKVSPVHGLNLVLQGDLQALMTKFEDLKEVDKLTSVHAKVEEAKEIMRTNVVTLLQNTDTIEEVNNQTEELRDHAATFQRRSTAAQRRFYWRHWRYRIILAVILCLLVAAILIPVLVSVLR
eukprot:tig00021348_g20593.t1